MDEQLQQRFEVLETRVNELERVHRHQKLMKRLTLIGILAYAVIMLIIYIHFIDSFSI